MLEVGFHPNWVALIMDCVKFTKFFILLNGVPTGSIIPQRGLCQGDPLSSYLFLLCSEALSALVTRVVSCNTIIGFKPSKHCPEISHLFFADSNLIFCKASIEQVWEFRSLLKT